MNKRFLVVVDILKDKNYVIDYYNTWTVNAIYHNNPSRCINVYRDQNDMNIVLEPVIVMDSRGKSKDEAIDIFSKIYDEVQKDINDINKQLNDRYSTVNIIKKLEECNVPNDIIDTIHLKMNAKEEDNND